VNLPVVNFSRRRLVELLRSSSGPLLNALIRISQVSGSLVSAFAKDLGVPEEKAQLKFQKPEGVETVGSYATQTAAKPFLQVDLAVRLPKVCRPLLCIFLILQAILRIQ
jgi:hypothetical protein